MSDTIREECGIALIRLLKPLSYYQEKYGTALWGFHKLFLLMEKQHNRGQDGAGIGALKLGVKPGEPYIFRSREIRRNPIDRIFKKLLDQYSNLVDRGLIHTEFAASVKKHFSFGAEIYMGHLRYGTSGDYNSSSCHPYSRKNNWPTKNLMLAGNFNLTNTPELNCELIQRGQHPIFATDTQTLLEEIGFYLDEEHDSLFKKYKNEGLSGPAISHNISDNLQLHRVLTKASQNWDGGYSLIGIVGNGDTFAFRDPQGIRPLSYFQNDEVIAFASERAPLLTAFDMNQSEIKEVEPGTAVIVKKTGSLSIEQIIPCTKKTCCSFERIYFSRGNDPDIYKERKALGAALADQILTSINNDLDHSVFSFIPNTAEIAYYGLTQELKIRRRQQVKDAIIKAQKEGGLNEALLDELIMKNWPRLEKVAWKDIKLRTFISQEKGRNQMASHVYDISYGSCSSKDNLICIDDSIVRGTTLKQSIIQMLARLNPKKIIIVSTAPQIRYPDCYGIDMSRLDRFIAFNAAVELLKESGEEGLLEEVYQECRTLISKPVPQEVNPVKKIYKSFSPEQISKKITQLISPKLSSWSGQVEIIYQSIESLHKALPEHNGDWYFTGNYPTPGGFMVVQRAYINYYEKNTVDRSY